MRRVGALLAALLCFAATPSSTLVGRWTLIDQRYGSGGANLVAPATPVRLEFLVSEGRLVGRVWTGGERSKVFPWPSFPAEGGPRSVDIRDINIDAVAGRARAVYRTAPSTPDGDVLEIVEEYRVAESGSVLLGTVTVGRVGPRGLSGSYVLHRRFERER
jgi:hypothetical protein